MRHLLVLGLYFCSGQFRDGCCVLRSDMLEDALRDVAALRRERRAFRSALVEVLRGAFELADAGGDGDGEVSMEECLRLDAEIAVRAKASLTCTWAFWNRINVLTKRERCATGGGWAGLR